MSILIGTSGFSYEDWRGYFYPERLKREEMLPFYSRTFPAVEINSTYYRLPPPAVFERMAERTPDGFIFVVKASREMTHTGRLLREAWAAFREAIVPLGHAGKLGGVLAQFPGSFRRTAANEDFLARIGKELPDTSVVVEFRNAEWIRDETFALLRREGLGYCVVDEPPLKGLVPSVVEVTSETGYVRFHGRNAEKWWRHEHAHERYDYLYPEEELREWAPRIAQISEQAERTFVFFNNNYLGKGLRNARRLAELLDRPLPWPQEEQGSLALD